MQLEWLLRSMKVPVRLLLLSAALVLNPRESSAVVHEIVSSFAYPPRSPGSGPMCRTDDGWFWDVTAKGGAFDKGTVYRVRTDGTGWEMVFSFSGDGERNKGANPLAGLMKDDAGMLWGTTAGGGPANQGTLFKLDPVSRILTTVVEFTGSEGARRGWGARGTLAAGPDGSLWGTTEGGGLQGHGTVFKYHPGTGAFTTVVDFTDRTGNWLGSDPRAGLALDDNGFFWGTTWSGGSTGAGTIFKLNATTGAGFSTVIQFSYPEGAIKGSGPETRLVKDYAGFMWGVTSLGGAEGSGTLFKVNPLTRALTTLAEFHTFPEETSNGAWPSGELIRDAAGTLWGSTWSGGLMDFGTIFRVEPDSGQLTTIHHIGATAQAGNDSSYAPASGLVFDDAGFLWGTAMDNQWGRGAVFRVPAAGGQWETMVTFHGASPSARGIRPYGGVVSDGNGWLWGTTGGGRDLSGTEESFGSVFKLDPTTGERITVHDADLSPGTGGTHSMAGLTADTSGFLWGTTSSDFNRSDGTIFKVNAATSGYESVLRFTGSVPSEHPGSGPLAGLTADAQGLLWGTTVSGALASNISGTLFSIDPATSDFRSVIQFSQAGSVNTGDSPAGQLVRDDNGLFWGTTMHGGAARFGSVFKFDPVSTTVTPVFEFTGISGSHPGNLPRAGLVMDGHGWLWGTTFNGGTGLGTLFKVHAQSCAFTHVASFTGNGGSLPGALPEAPLSRDGAGFLWGTTSRGGSADKGTLFKVNAATGAVSSVISFTGTGDQPNSGANPRYGALYLHSDGHLYGTTELGGPGGAGTVYRLRFGPTVVTLAATDVSANSATLQGTVNPNGSLTAAGFEWGTDPAFPAGSRYRPVGELSGTSVVALSGALYGLSPGTTYFFRVRGTSADSPSPQHGEVMAFTTTGTNPDADHDGLPDSWEVTHWGSTAGHNASGDADGDGAVELLEYAFGQNPKVAGGTPLPAPSVSEGFLTIAVSRQPGVTYVVETTSNPASGWDAAGTSVVADTAAVLTVRDTISSGTTGSRFMRIRVYAP